MFYNTWNHDDISLHKTSIYSFYFPIAVIMFLISWAFTVVSLALATLIYYYVSIKGKAGDWGDGFKSAYFQLALRSLRSLGGLCTKFTTASSMSWLMITHPCPQLNALYFLHTERILFLNMLFLRLYLFGMTLLIPNHFFWV